MAEGDLLATQQDAADDISAELRAEGFEDAEEIGRGGFGVVYRCIQPMLERTVAVKVLSTGLDADNVERFLREQHAMGRLSGHPNIVNIVQVGVTGSGRNYLVMPYCPKNSLEALVRKHGPLDWVATLSIGVKVAGALATAHQAGILHRDVKPANILMSDYGEPQLCDFGIAHIAGGFQTRAGLITGSPAFTAPEVLEGKPPSPASDIYSLGSTLFCALTGHAAFERKRGETVMSQFLRITAQPIPDLSGRVPDDVSAVITTAMARDPADRPVGAAAFGELLQQVQRHNDVAVDKMALPTHSGVEQQAGTPAASAGRVLPGRRISSGRAGAARSEVAAPPTPATKYRPPVPIADLVTRARLIDRLRAGGRRRLVFVHAPSGFGKSTLAAQWCAELARQGVDVGWLTIDDDDNNVVWFLAHLLKSIHRVRPTLAESLGRMLEQYGADADRYLLTALVDELHASDVRMVVVLDDWHRVTNPKTMAALGFLLDNGCHHLELIVTSWSRSGLPLSKMRIRDELVEIDQAALRFTGEESRKLLIDIGGLKLSPGDVDALTAGTDGWVAGIKLATFALHDGSDVASLLDRMSERDEVIGEFLAENVLNTLQPELRDFLLATSITERTCGPLASALAGTPRGQAMLEDVEQRGLFLQRGHNDRSWFRYHRMFVQFLRRRLERDCPDQVDRLHRTASAWFSDNHHLNEAVDHALAAEDPELAVELVETGARHLLERSKMSTLLETVKKLPPQLVVGRPLLQLFMAWANILLQRAAPTHTALNRFEAAAERAGLPEAARAAMRTEANVVRGVVEILGDRTDGIDALVAEALARPDEQNIGVAGVAGDLAAFAAIYRFDFDAARRYLDAAMRHQAGVGPFAAVYRACFGGIAARYQLDIPTAMAEFRQAYQLAAGIGASRAACALLGELLYQTGELTEAKRFIDESYALGAEGGGVDAMAARYVTAALIKAAEGDRDAAAGRLADGMIAAQAQPLPRLAARITNERIRLGITIAPELATELKSARTIPHDNGIATLTAELDEDSGVRLLSASDSAADRAQACQRARDLVAGIDGDRRPWAALQAQLLLVETLRAAGSAEAEAAARPVIAACTRTGLLRLLADAGLA